MTNKEEWLANNEKMNGNNNNINEWQITNDWILNNE